MNVEKKRNRLKKTAVLVTPSFVKSIMSEATPVRKNEIIEAIRLTDKTTIISKEGVCFGEEGDYKVVKNGEASANYIIKANRFEFLYEKIQEHQYRRRRGSFAYRIDMPFYIFPTWNEGVPLFSSPTGGYLIIHDETDFNICSFEDFELTYEFVEAE